MQHWRIERQLVGGGDDANRRRHRWVDGVVESGIGGEHRVNIAAAGDDDEHPSDEGQGGCQAQAASRANFGEIEAFANGSDHLHGTDHREAGQPLGRADDGEGRVRVQPCGERIDILHDDLSGVPAMAGQRRHHRQFMLRNKAQQHGLAADRAERAHWATGKAGRAPAGCGVGSERRVIKQLVTERRHIGFADCANIGNGEGDGADSAQPRLWVL